MIRGAIDRTIAEEQARQQKLAEGSGAAPARSASASSRGAAAKRPARATRPSADMAAADAANTDPAVFEAAFVIDDSDDASRAPTPKPQPPDKDVGSAAVGDAGAKEQRQHGDAAAKARDNGERSAPVADAKEPAPPELGPEIKQRLRKLERLEATYPGESPAWPEPVRRC